MTKAIIAPNHRRNAGFSIVELLVVAGLLGFLSITLGQMIMNAMKGQKNVQNSIDFDLVKMNVAMALKSRACDTALKRNKAGKPLKFSIPSGIIPLTDIITTPLAVASIDLGATPLAAKDMDLGGGMKLSHLNITSAIYNGEVTYAPKTYESFSVLLSLGADKNQHSLGAKSLSTKIGVTLLTQGGVVRRCLLETDPKPDNDVQNEALDPARLWLKRQVVCRTATGGYSLLTLSTEDGGVLHYAASHGSRPMWVRYNATNGKYISHSDAPAYTAQSCVGAGKSLKTISKDADNKFSR